MQSCKRFLLHGRPVLVYSLNKPVSKMEDGESEGHLNAAVTARLALTLYFYQISTPQTVLKKN